MSKKASRNLKISASILSLDFTKLEHNIKIIDKLADSIHLDVMDGNFVDNLTFGSKIISDIRKLTDLNFDTHLMISNPDKFALEYAKAGSNIITFHIEAVEDPDITIKSILDTGCKVGVAICPETSHKLLTPFLQQIDKVLIMTVNPGFGGQQFMHHIIPKIQSILDMRAKLYSTFEVSLDGGINANTILDIRHLDIDEIVVGSYLFDGDIINNFSTLRKLYLQ